MHGCNANNAQTSNILTSDNKQCTTNKKQTANMTVVLLLI